MGDEGKQGEQKGRTVRHLRSSVKELRMERLEHRYNYLVLYLWLEAVIDGNSME